MHLMKTKVFLRKKYFALRNIAITLIGLHKAGAPATSACAIDSIVALRIDRIGDLVLSLPALKALKALFPASHLTLILRKHYVPLLKGTPFIDELIPYNNFLSTVVLLRKRKFSLAIDLLMDYSLKTALLVFLSDALVRVGFDIEGRGKLFNFPLTQDPKRKHMSEHMLGLVESLSFLSLSAHKMSKYTDPELFVSAENKIFAEEFFRARGAAKGDTIIGIHPGGYYKSQRWSIRNFADLANYISKKYHAKIMLVASRQEQALMHELLFLLSEKPILVFGFRLDQCAALIASASLFIANNSGPLHIAAALGIPTVSTMGPTDPDLFWPLGKNHIVIKRDVNCSPCNLGVCQRHCCMKLITVEEMKRAVDMQMNGIHSEER